MKKYTAILLLLSFLFNNTEVHQLLGAPALFNHFVEHQKSNTHLSWADFLKKHYSHNHQQEKEQNTNDHDKLPFKSNDCQSTHFNLSFIIIENSRIQEPLAFKCKEEVEYNTFFSSSILLSNIWQPPKLS